MQASCQEQQEQQGLQASCQEQQEQQGQQELQASCQVPVLQAGFKELETDLESTSRRGCAGCSVPARMPHTATPQREILSS